eukprot:5779833-Prymnesium_polylepis.1
MLRARDSYDTSVGPGATAGHGWCMGKGCSRMLDLPRSPAMLNPQFPSGPVMGLVADRPSGTPTMYVCATAA